ncbi:MAG: hypothetical protein RL318_660 [Fibrobacterota bacterium]|jgi:hypothetical protein
MRHSRSLTTLLLAGTTLALAQHESKTVIGGYAEAEYVNPVAGAAKKSHADLHRFVLFVSHGFSEQLSFHSELEVEHVLTEMKVSKDKDGKVTDVSAPGYVSVEQAFIDYRLAGSFGFRTGVVLAPVGIVNEVHEPDTYHGVHRPLYANSFVPTTWRDMGLLAYGSPMEGLQLRGGVMAGLLGNSIGGASGLRGGRQKAGKSNAENLSLTARAEYALPGVKLGLSGWYGGTSMGDTALGDGNFDAPVTMVAGDLRAEWNGAFLRGEVGWALLSEAEKMQKAYKKSPGEQMAGGYIEAGYDLLPLFLPQTQQSLTPFARFERIDTHYEVPSNVSLNKANSQSQWVAGLTWKPVSRVAFKFDYSWLRNEAGTAERDEVKLGAGCSF